MAQTWLRDIPKGSGILRHYKEFGSSTFTAKLYFVPCPGVEGRRHAELTPAQPPA